MRRASKPVVSAVFVASVVTFVSLVRVRSANAQVPESIGVRAQGMGGAFTAVADDATAVWWNPAGLAGGSYFSSILEYGHPNDPPDTNIKGGIDGVSRPRPALLPLAPQS